MTLGPISGKYIQGVLAARGVRVGEEVLRFAQRLDDAQATALAQQLRRIELGVEQPQDIPAILDSIRAADQAAQQPSPPAASQPRTAAPPSSRLARSAGALAGSRERRKTPAAAPDQDLALLRSHGVHVWGSSGALKVELARRAAASTDEGDPQPYTVQIEGARKGRDGYAWERKLIFQFTRGELPLVTAFLLGFAGPSLVLSNHGPSADKQLTLQEQGDRLFCRLTQLGEAPIAVPIPAADVFACAEICCAALALNRPTCPPEMQLALLRRVGQLVSARSTSVGQGAAA